MRTTDNDDTSLVAVLGLPQHSRLNVDGKTLVLQRDDFVGFVDVPADTTFHLITVQAAPRRSEQGSSSSNNNGSIGIFTGLYFDGRLSGNTVRQYDPQKEEISSVAVEERVVEQLLSDIRDKRIGPPRIIPFNQLFSLDDANLYDEWKSSTCYISEYLLASRGITSGCKIVPGTFDFDDDNDDKTTVTDNSQHTSDGVVIKYPSVPVIEKNKRHTKHKGTSRFMRDLSPQQRTSIFIADCPSDAAFLLYNKLAYQPSGDTYAVLGDLQLSLTMFLNLQCYDSLQHWRDLLVMLSLVSTDIATQQYRALYTRLITVISIQIRCIDDELLAQEDVEGLDVDANDGNSILMALQRLQKLFTGMTINSHTSADLNIFARKLEKFKGVDVSIVDDLDIDDDSTDGPLIVDMIDVEASLERQRKQYGNDSKKYSNTVLYSTEAREKYPILFAAMLPHEDVVMTCARALADATDVSLVRESADYLECVEHTRHS